MVRKLYLNRAVVVDVHGDGKAAGGEKHSLQLFGLGSQASPSRKTEPGLPVPVKLSQASPSL